MIRPSWSMLIEFRLPDRIAVAAPLITVASAYWVNFLRTKLDITALQEDIICAGHIIIHNDADIGIDQRLQQFPVFREDQDTMSSAGGNIIIPSPSRS
jgi:hypothetical protein